MTVYIVWWNNFHSDDEFSGVFSTRENAENYIENYSECDKSSFRIEETCLDNW